jgi:drug/metabolite transporter (DMT)-like permease
LNRELLGFALVVTAALLWATLGLFYKTILALEPNFTPLNIVFFRIAFTSLIIFLAQAFRGKLSPKRVDWALFLGYALLGIAIFYPVYAYTIDAIGVGMAAILMYTAPAWVAIFSHFLFGEKLTAFKIAAIALTFTGSALVAGIYKPGTLRLNLYGVLLGLGAGLTYSFYNIFNKLAVQRHSVLDTLMYSMGLGAIFLLPLNVKAIVLPFRNLKLLLWLLALSIIPSLGGGFCYITALRFIPVSVASITANLEPLAAAAFGALLFGERMEWPQILGASLIISGVVVLQVKRG